MTTLGILILAGGRSSRMGQDKASLVLEGQPMLARICQRVAGPNTQVVVVARAQQVLPDLAPAVVRVDDDAQLAGNGPLTALGTGLRWFVAKKIEYVCFLACDMPDASRANLVYLVERLRNSEAEAIWTCDDAGRGQPLHAVVRADKLMSRCEAMTAAGERRLTQLFLQSRVITLARAQLPEPAGAQSYNSPHELQARQRTAQSCR